MDHFRENFRRSWDDSWQLFFAAPARTVLLAVLVWAVAALLQWRSFGPVMAALASIVWTLIATVIVFVCLFLFHFVYLTPKRMIDAVEEKAGLEADRADRIEKDLKSKITKLEDRLKSRITVRCGKDIEGCVSRDHRGIWYRARLDMTGPNVSGVEASIIGILENDVKVNLYGENLDVSICEKEGKGQTVLMREGRPEYINLIFAAYDATKPPVLSLKHWPAPLGDRAYFKLNHEYQMSVVITCDNPHPSVPFTVKMKLKSNEDLEEFQLL